jgi:hypothetical protein
MTDIGVQQKLTKIWNTFQAMDIGDTVTNPALRCFQKKPRKVCKNIYSIGANIVCA